MKLDKLKKFFCSKNCKILITFILSFISTLGIVTVYDLYSGTQRMYNSLINVVIFVLYYNFWSNIKSSSKKEKCLAIIYAIFLSTIIILGTQLELYNDIIWNIITLLKTIFTAFSIYPIIIFILSKLKNTMPEKLKINKNKYSFIITYSIIFIFNFLVFLALYPGLYGYDAGFQILEILDPNTSITTHFSVVYCFVLARCVNLGNVLFNSYTTGFAIYTFLQMIFLTYVYTKITMYVYKKSNKFYMYLLSMLFFSFFPHIKLMSVSSAQDAIFGGVFALIIIHLLNMVEDSAYFTKKRNMFFLILHILLLCLIRNNGLYCILFTIPFVIIFIKTKRNKLIGFSCFIIPIVLYKIIVGPIYTSINIAETDTYREMLSIPSQQLARVYNYNYDVLDENNLVDLSHYYMSLNDFNYYVYRQSIADPTKSQVNNDAVKTDLFGYIKFWLNVGQKDLPNYTEAFLLNSLGFWYPNKDYQDDRMYHPYIEFSMLDAKFWNENYVEITRHSKFPLYEKILDIFILHNAWKKIPVLSSIFTLGTYFIIFVFLLLQTLFQKKWKYLLPISTILGLYVTLFLSPVALFRYGYPIVIILPILISMIINKNNSENYDNCEKEN